VVPPVSSRGKEPADLALAAALAVLLPVYNNVVGNRPWHRRRYVAANLSATAMLLALARSRGFSPNELGLALVRAPAGARLGGVLGAVVVCGLTVAAAAPATRPCLRDARVTMLGWPSVAYQAVVRVPVGTVLWEEIAFRGVLLASLARVLPTGRAVAASSALFGLWHVRPTLDALRINQLAAGPVRTATAVAAAGAVTALAGALLTGLRRRTGSLLAPALVHFAANSASTVAAAIAARLC
jgi:membrane protease YdiL (CAAX protease family)